MKLTILVMILILVGTTHAPAVPTLVSDDNGLRRALGQARPGTIIRIAPPVSTTTCSTSVQMTASIPPMTV